MKLKNPRVKGDKYNREIIKKICKIFGLEYNEDFRKKHRWESGNDSLHLTQKARRIFPFSVECKDVKHWQLIVWWDKLLNDTKEKDLIPVILLHRQNTSKSFVFMDFEDFAKLTKELSDFREKEYWQKEGNDERQ